MADPPQDIDAEALAEQVVAELDPGSVIDDKVVLSRRQLLALTGGGAGLAALGFGTGQASAADGSNDTSVGDVGAAGDSVDVFVDELRDDGGDEWLDVDDTGDINAAFGRTWNYDAINTDELLVNGSISSDPKNPTKTISLSNNSYAVSELLVGLDIVADGTNKTIVDNGGKREGVFVVHGVDTTDNTRAFTDTVSQAIGGTLKTVNTNTASADSRSYSFSGGELLLSISGSGQDYNIFVTYTGGRGASV